MRSRLARAERLLAWGLRPLGSGFTTACRDAVLAFRCADGGFRGRQGSADLWYTDFALRTLVLTGAPAEVFTESARWLENHAPPIDQPAVFNRLNLHRMLNLKTAFGVRRSAFGVCLLELLTLKAFAHPRNDTDIVSPYLSTPNASSRISAYHILLDSACCDLTGQRPPARLVTPLAQLARADGGFAERSDELESQVNASAAALAALALAGQLDRRTRNATALFLASQQGEDGGLKAHPLAPASDLLSTFTALWALNACRRLDSLRLGDLGRFVLRCRSVNGGFSASPDDGADDPEYIYYGLAALALLRLHADDGFIHRMRRWWILLKPG